MAQRQQTFGARISRAFRAREIYVRSEGHVRYITLKPYMQVFLVCLPLGLVVAGVAGGIGLNRIVDTSAWSQFDFKISLNSLWNKTAEIKTADLVETTPKKSQKIYEKQIAKFQGSINQINVQLAKNKGAHRKEIKHLRQQYSNLEQRHFELEDLLDQGWAPRNVSAPVSSSQFTPQKTEAETSGAPATTATIMPGKQSAADIIPSAHQGTEEFADLKSSMASHWKQQNKINTKISVSAQKRLDEMLRVFASLKFDTSTLSFEKLKKDVSGMGGPLVKLASSDKAAAPDDADRSGFASLNPFQKIYLMETALLELPIRRPISDLATISSPYGPRIDPIKDIYAMHHGIDFQTSEGEPIFATAAGVVIKRKYNTKTGYGKLVTIQHKHKMTTQYGHLSNIQVRIGDRVKPGDIIGLVGNTGRSTGPHLHYEIRVGETFVNPTDYLEAAKYVF